MESILEASSGVISKKYSAKKSSFTILIMLLGIITIAAAALFTNDFASTMYTSLTSIGAIVVIICVIVFLTKGHDFVYTPTKSKIGSYSIFFKVEEIQRLIHAIEHGNAATIHQLLGDSSSGGRLDVVVSEDEQFAACQIFRYVPYNYEAQTSVYKISEENLPSFCATIKELNQSPALA